MEPPDTAAWAATQPTPRAPPRLGIPKDVGDWGSWFTCRLGVVVRPVAMLRPLAGARRWHRARGVVRREEVLQLLHAAAIQAAVVEARVQGPRQLVARVLQ